MYIILDGVFEWFIYRSLKFNIEIIDWIAPIQKQVIGEFSVQCHTTVHCISMCTVWTWQSSPHPSHIDWNLTVIMRTIRDEMHRCPMFDTGDNPKFVAFHIRSKFNTNFWNAELMCLYNVQSNVSPLSVFPQFVIGQQCRSEQQILCLEIRFWCTLNS